MTKTNMEMENIHAEYNLIGTLQSLIEQKEYNRISVILEDENMKPIVVSAAIEIVQLCFTYLTDELYNKNMEFYNFVEYVLTYVSKFGNVEEILFELLEIIETTDSDNVFTSALKGLQILLLRQKESKPRSLEWSLNSIQSYIYNCELPEFINSGYDERQEKLLEQDNQINRILTNYYTIFLFYEPILEEILEKKNLETEQIFKDTRINRKNIFICFLLQLLAKPLAMFDIVDNDKKTNLYTLKCCQTLCEDLTKLLGDPFILLEYVEKRIRWPLKCNDETMYDITSRDLFWNNEKVSMESLGIFYFLLITNEYGLDKAPKVYRPMYIFESCLYLVVHLLSMEEDISISYKGLLLCKKTLENLNSEQISIASLDLKVHSMFYDALSEMIIYSDMERNRKVGIKLLKDYILQFEDEGKFLILKNIIPKTKHTGLLAYLITIFKNVLANKLEFNVALPKYFNASDFKNLLLKSVCTMKNNAETDLMENYDQIISALNTLRYFALRDKKNITGFWSFIAEIDKQFLDPLRKAIDLSRAHYKAENYRVSNDIENKDCEDALVNITTPSGESISDINKEQKLKMLSNALVSFDLMDSLLARVNECISYNQIACN